MKIRKFQVLSLYFDLNTEMRPQAMCLARGCLYYFPNREPIALPFQIWYFRVEFGEGEEVIEVS